MSINTKVEQIAYGHATALVLSELGQQENWCKAYEYLSECVERETNLRIWSFGNRLSTGNGKTFWSRSRAKPSLCFRLLSRF